MHKKKEDTMQRISRRKYEEKNKVERQSKSGNFQTMIPRATFEEINGFLKENNITPKQMAMVGDRPLTDILFGKILGCTTILVDSISWQEEKPIVRIARKLEKIFS